nr:MAG TPA: hypothetical protein [Caudoviricetes sp.]
MTTEIPYKPYACGHQARSRADAFLFSSIQGQDKSLSMLCMF